MALQKYRFVIDEKQRGLRLDQALAELLSAPAVSANAPLSKAKVRKLIVAGAVYLNGKRVRIASKALHPGAKVEVLVEWSRLEGGSRPTESRRAFVLEQTHVVYEDEHLIAFNKPPGLPTQPTLDDARENLFAAVKKFLSRRDSLADPYVGLHHRLDRDTSGVVLFTKTKAANPGVARAFAEHQARKIYVALTARGERKQAAQWQVRNFLAKSTRGGKRARMQSVRAGGDVAETSFRLLAESPHAFKIQAEPRTGRMHQIRVHLSEAGLPILGDDFYGGPRRVGELVIPRVLLHAASLSLPHPLTGSQLRIEAPLPEDFETCARALLLD